MLSGIEHSIRRESGYLGICIIIINMYGFRSWRRQQEQKGKIIIIIVTIIKKEKSSVHSWEKARKRSSGTVWLWPVPHWPLTNYNLATSFAYTPVICLRDIASRDSNPSPFQFTFLFPFISKPQINTNQIK